MRAANARTAARRNRPALWALLSAAVVGGALAAYHYGPGTTNSNVATAQARLGDLVIRVATRGRLTGADASGQPGLGFDLSVEEVDRGKVRVGQPVNIRLDAIRNREFRGKLVWIGNIAGADNGDGDTPKLFPARAAVEGADRRLQEGMTGSADIVVEVIPQQVLIPTQASFLSNGQPAVYVQKGHEFELHAIEAGRRNDTEMAVKRGLSPGDRVALKDPTEVARRARKL